MSRPMTVSDDVLIAADPMTIWAQLADPSQMGRWSPENQGADVPTPGQPLAVGTSFVGRNKRGRAQWVTKCRVTASDPGRRFAFDVIKIGPRKPLLGGPIATWSYDLVAADGGTLVTETWTDNRRGWPDLLAAAFDKTVTGGRLFSDFQRRNIRKTLDRLKTDLERAA